MGLFGGDSTTVIQTTSQNIDRRATTTQGPAYSISDITTGGPLTITSTDAEIAQRAIEAAENLSAKSMDAAKDFALNSNNIAAKVADSQTQFVATASGQKTILYVVGGLALAFVALFYMFSKK